MKAGWDMKGYKLMERRKVRNSKRSFDKGDLERSIDSHDIRVDERRTTLTLDLFGVTTTTAIQ